MVYGYEKLELPPGAEFVSAETVLPETEIFAYQHGPGKGSYAAFADVFRYKLLRDHGGTWVDADVLCLKPFDTLPSACAGRQDDKLVAIGVMRFPPNHPLVIALYDEAVKLGKNIRWGQAGPKIFTKLVSDYPDVVCLAPSAFYPIPWPEAWRYLLPEENTNCEKSAQDAYAAHWWNEILRKIGIPKEKLPPKGSWLFNQASTVFNSESLDCWPGPVVRVWADNYREAQNCHKYPSGEIGGEPADLLREKGYQLLREKDWKRAVDFLAAAHRLRPNGIYIRLMLGQGLFEIGKIPDAIPHLQAALNNASTRQVAEEYLAKSKAQAFQSADSDGTG